MRKKHSVTQYFGYCLFQEFETLFPLEHFLCVHLSSHIVLINDINPARQHQHARSLSHIKQRYMELRVFDITAKWLDSLQVLDPCRFMQQ